VTPGAGSPTFPLQTMESLCTLSDVMARHMDSQGVSTPVIEVSLSSPLRRIAYAMVNRVYDPSDHEGYTKFKDEAFPQFGCTGRRLMIDISERFLKNEYGISVMARILLDDLREFPPYPFNGVALIRDCGFQCEINPLVDVVGADNLMIVRVNRPGYDFSRDSREWVTHKHVYEADNSAGLTELKSQAETLYTCLTQFLGWKL
jgi:hypothetical protein